jgi:hypothetical protein
VSTKRLPFFEQNWQISGSMNDRYDLYRQGIGIVNDKVTIDGPKLKRFVCEVFPNMPCLRMFGE